MSEYIEEIDIEEYPIAVSMEDTENKILFQMKNCICKIIKDNGSKGTGFFLKYNYNNELLHLFITNYHVLNEDDINNNKSIEITLNDDKDYKKLIIGNRIKFTDPELDITFLEIYPKKDNIKYFLDINDDINKEEDLLKRLYIKKSVYLLHYPKGGSKINVSYGITKGTKDKELFHYLNTSTDSSGSPILSLETFKVIGIHKGGAKFLKPGEPKYNIGVLLKYAIEAFIKNKNKHFKCLISNFYKSTVRENINDLVKGKQVINITEDGEFKKYIVKEGKGIKPIKGDEIELIYQHPMTIWNEKIILGNDDDNQNHKHIAIKSMKVGEIAMFFISPKYQQIISTNVIRYKMELLLENLENPDMIIEKKFLEGKKLKEKGVELFKKGDIPNACLSFKLALEDLNNIKYNNEDNKDNYISLNIAILSNLCNCYNSMKDYNNVIKIANKGLKIKEYSKFYYFRAIAFAKNNEMENAKKDLASLKKMLGEKSIDEGVKFLEEMIGKNNK